MKKLFVKNPLLENYIIKVAEDSVCEALLHQNPLIDNLIKSVNEQEAKYAYAEGKWTIAQMLQHIIDTERIFACRAVCFARGEKQIYPAFDENEYADAAPASHRSWSDLSEEFIFHRKSIELFFKTLPTEKLSMVGKAGNSDYSVAMLGFAMVGHFYHHAEILQSRYGIILQHT